MSSSYENMQEILGTRYVKKNNNFFIHLKQTIIKTCISILEPTKVINASYLSSGVGKFNKQGSLNKLRVGEG